MSRGIWTALALMTAVALPLPTGAQDGPDVDLFLKRVQLDEQKLDDQLDAFGESDLISFASQIGVPAAARTSGGFEMILAQAVDFDAAQRYEKILENYRHILQNDEPQLINRSLKILRPTLGVTSRDSQAQIQDWLLRLPPSI